MSRPIRLDGFTKSELDFLHKYSCALCDQPLDRRWCGALDLGPPSVRKCSMEELEDRARRCLDER